MRILSGFSSIVKNRMGVTGLPRFLTYTVTFACNARCVMCDSWRKRRGPELAVHELERVVDKLPKMDAIRLTGGEPFARVDFPAIAEVVQSRLCPSLLHVTTNGILGRRVVEFCERRDRSVPLQLLISIDGMQEKHDEVRGRGGAWERAVETLKELAPRRSELRLRLAVNQTVMDEDGLEEYRRLREYLRRFDVPNHVVLAYESSAMYSVEAETAVDPEREGLTSVFGRWNLQDMEALLRTLEHDLKEYPVLERLAKGYYLRGVRNRALHGKREPSSPCTALNAHLRLLPNGDVPTCQFNTRRVGNLLHQDLRELWFGPRTEAQRRWVRRCRGCWAECEVLPSAIYTGDLLRQALHLRSFGRRAVGGLA
jgi:MoaA/NifB/PqqE/SkfB family radical SAM enzyme